MIIKIYVDAILRTVKVCTCTFSITFLRSASIIFVVAPTDKEIDSRSKKTGKAAIISRYFDV